MKQSTLTCFLALLSGAVYAADTPYSAAIKALTPTYYYELNETDPDIEAVDAIGNATEEGFYNGEYGFEGEEGFAVAGCEGPLILNDIPTAEENPDFVNTFEYFPQPVPGVGGEANRAHCSNNVGHVDLGPSDEYGASAMTVSMFFRHEGKGGTSGDRLFTNNLTDAATSFQVNTAGEGLVVAVNPNASGELAERTLFNVGAIEPDRALIDGEYGWFHVVASTSGDVDERADNIQVWINGVNRTEDLTITDWGWGVDTDIAKIGGRRDDGADSTTHIGAQDEVAIWLDRVLTEEEVQSIWNAATGGDACTPGTGDIDGNGKVEFADFLVLSGNFGKEGAGDIDCSGTVDFADFLTLSGNFGKEVAAAQAVPEPNAASLLALGALCMGLVRRRR